MALAGVAARAAVTSASGIALITQSVWAAVAAAISAALYAVVSFANSRAMDHRSRRKTASSLITQISALTLEDNDPRWRIIGEIAADAAGSRTDSTDRVLSTEGGGSPTDVPPGLNAVQRLWQRLRGAIGN